MRNQYVLLTGGKNNAGDFLIKHRIKELLREMRPDRELVDYDAWKPLTSEQLKTINDSKALILAGGPALQNKMHPNIYPLVEELNDIKVPIIMMGIGWKSGEGSWEATKRYPLSEKTILLLNKISGSGYSSSVRDYHTLNVLNLRGFKNILMTGCPVLYSLNHLTRTLDYPKKFKKVSFSMGVSFVQSKPMEDSMKNTILSLRKYFTESEFDVVFHHSINKEQYLKTHNSKIEFAEKHDEFIEWLKSQKINFADISGSEEKLIEHYSACDLHIGYRVHAHIFMNSILRPSILLNEDGRGKALTQVIGGLIFDGYKFQDLQQDILSKISRKINKRTFSPITPVENLADDVVKNIDYEIKEGFPRISQSQHQIKRHFLIMQKFINQLP